MFSLVRCVKPQDNGVQVRQTAALKAAYMGVGDRDCFVKIVGKQVDSRLSGHFHC